MEDFVQEKDNIISEQESETGLDGIEQLEQEIECQHSLDKSLEREYNRISLLRLVSFLVLATGILIAVVEGLWWGWLLTIIGGVIFALLLIRHNGIAQHQDYTSRRIRVLERIRKRMTGTWYELQDTGTEFLDAENYVAKDLDILGTHSLYQMICTAHTATGKSRLAHVLLRAQNAEIDLEELLDRQQAVQELADNRNFRVNFEALALEQEEEAGKHKTSDRHIELEEAETDSKQASSQTSNAGFRVLYVLACIWPLLIVLAIVGAGMHWWKAGVILVVYFAGLLLSWMTGGYCQSFTSDIFANRERLRSNLYLMEACTQEVFHSRRLLFLQQQMKSGEKDGAMYAMKRLERLLAAYNLRHNPIVHFLLCGICLYDVHLTRGAILWEIRYGTCVHDSVNALAELEMLNSLAQLAVLRPGSYPVIRTDVNTPYLELRQGYHPLLNPMKAVPNSIRLDAGPRVITGSNMSGKTTFLRTLGINVILAYAGASVCAEYMELSVMRPYTSMRIADDVNHGISTFYAEILRIKEMAEYAAKEQPMLCLIDEIFKGTNSADRIVGAKAVIRKLTKTYIISAISTHDFELCGLADNYHFEEYYDKEGIQFDYQLREGVCQTTNALYLLKLAGLTEEESDFI